MYKLLLKRTFDFLLALITFLLVLPISFSVFIILFIANQGKPIFYQLRPGLDGKIFKIFKFRTMNDKKNLKGELLPDSMRLTKVGIFIRKTSIDEIPQLLNVIKGDMSLIGPRPLLPEYLPLYSDEQKKRHLVRPGITGWAQVNGRNAISWDDKFKFDVWYVNNLTFWLDLRIILMTIKKVVFKEGITSVTSSTMEKFKGN